MGQEPRRAQLRRIPQDRPEAEEKRGRDADPGPDGKQAQYPEGDRHVERADDRGHQLGIGGQAPDGDKWHQQDGRQWGKRHECVASRLAVRPNRWDDVLELIVTGPGRPGRNRVADGGAPVQKGLSLPHEVVVVRGPIRIADEIDAEQQERDREAGHDRKAGTGAGVGETGVPGVRRRALRYTPLHLSARAGGGPPW